MKIEIYGRDTCPFCRRAKELAAQHDPNFSYHDVEKDKNAQIKREAFAEKYNHSTVPVVFIDGEFVGGYSEMAAKMS